MSEGHAIEIGFFVVGGLVATKVVDSGGGICDSVNPRMHGISGSDGAVWAEKEV